MDRPLPNNARRNFGYFFWFIVLFVGIRIWVEVINIGDKTALIITSVVTFVLLLCFIFQCYRQRQANDVIYRLNRNEQMQLLNLFLRAHEAGLNPATGGLTQESIDSLPTKSYGVATLDKKVNDEKSDTSDTKSNTNTTAEQLRVMEEGGESGALNYSGESEHNCSICLSDYVSGDVLISLPNCHHNYHRACISEWLLLHNNCPLCKACVFVMAPEQPAGAVGGEGGAAIAPGVTVAPTLRLSALHQQDAGSANFYILDGDRLHFVLSAATGSSSSGSAGMVARGSSPPVVDGDGFRSNNHSNSNGNSNSNSGSSAVVYSAWNTASSSAMPNSSNPVVHGGSTGVGALNDASSSGSRSGSPVRAATVNVSGLSPTSAAAAAGRNWSSNSSSTARHFDSADDEYTNSYLR